MFSYSNNDLYCEQVALADVAAKRGHARLRLFDPDHPRQLQRLRRGLRRPAAHAVCYAVKANSSLAVLALLAKAGAGFDIVSGGELARVLAAGGDASRVVFSGVGKTAAELEYALDNGIHSFNCESEPEIGLLDSLAARRGIKAGFSIRVNPGCGRLHASLTSPPASPRTSSASPSSAPAPSTSMRVRLRAIFRPRASAATSARRSSIPAPLLEAVDMLLELALQLRAAGSLVRHLDLGGGLGIAYRPGEIAPAVAAFVEGLRERLADTGLTVMVEPGRSIVGPAGVLLTRVLYRKRNGAKEFIVVDAAMNDLIRPALYQAHHEIVPLRRTALPPVTADVVGPICESGDFLARDRPMANAMPGDFLAVCAAGAYGFVQSSNYNSRPRAVEVLVDGAAYRVIRQRETYADLMRGETI
jgi:diaminopimelate decarboxylase